MRILIATTHRTIAGGVETYIRALLPELVDRGHELALVYEVVPAPDQPFIDDHLSAMPCWLFDDPELLEKVAQWQPDICYLQGLVSSAAEELLVRHFPTVFFAHNHHGTCISGAKRFAFPSVHPCQRTFGPACLALYFPRRCGGLNPSTMAREFLVQRRRQSLFTAYRAVLVASKHMWLEFEKHGVPGERLHLVPLFAPGMAPDRLPPKGQPFKDRVLFVGRLTDVKGVKLLVPALAQAGNILDRQLTLVVAGDGPERAGLERQVQRARLSAEFHGWVGDDKRLELMRGADVLAVPSVWPEPFALVGMEASCVGLPAVGFAVGGISDWLIAGQSGELADGLLPTVAGLRDAIVRALSDLSHLQRLRRGAWEVAQRFTLDRHLDQLESVLVEHAIAARNKAPAR